MGTDRLELELLVCDITIPSPLVLLPQAFLVPDSPDPSLCKYHKLVK
jgi:hypothetical protein